MKTTIILSALAAAIMLTSCTTEETGPVITVNLADNDRVDEVGELFSVVSVLRPALTDSTLLSDEAGIVGTDGNSVYIRDNDRFMVFDAADGDCHASFSRRGQGPEEFLSGWYAWKSVGSPGWTVFDYRGRKVLSYTEDGRFMASRANESVRSLMPCGAGWAAEGMFVEGEHKKFYLYSSDWDNIATINTPLVYWSMDDGNTLSGTDYVIAGRQTMILENDTLYNLSQDGSFTPVCAFDCGNLKMPQFNTFDEYRAHKDEYIDYSVYATDRHLLILSWLRGEGTVRVVSREDGRVLYCSTPPSDVKLGVLPVKADGLEMWALPEVYGDGEHLWLWVPSDEMSDLTGDPEHNPLFLKVKITL